MVHTHSSGSLFDYCVLSFDSPNSFSRVNDTIAASKGKYVALAVLLPRVGALRALELCPSLVEQLVWAVGVRGNVSGQAVSLLLQLLKAVGAEVGPKPSYLRNRKKGPRCLGLFARAGIRRYPRR